MTLDQSIAIAGVAVSALGPLAVIWIAFLANKRFKHFERAIENQRRISDTRFELYRDIGFQLNDIFAYFQYVGNWKESNPDQIVEKKRHLDRHVFTFGPVFSDEFVTAYNRFILDCFQMYGGWRKDARLRTTSKHRKEVGDPDWARCFTEENNRKDIRNSYDVLLRILAKDLSLEAEEE